MGIDLIRLTLREVAAGVIRRQKQDEAVATWEPSWDRPPVARPDLPRLPAPGAEGPAHLLKAAALNPF
jgi:methionyl-tRNA formyltransferase